MCQLYAEDGFKKSDGNNKTLNLTFLGVKQGDSLAI